jgi:predicted nucleic acid-binding protein
LLDPIGRSAHLYVAQYAKPHGLTLADALIAATAAIYDLTLVSRNEKHFRPVKGLRFLKAIY